LSCICSFLNSVVILYRLSLRRTTYGHSSFLLRNYLSSIKFLSMKKNSYKNSHPRHNNWKLINDLLNSSAEKYPDKIVFKDSSGRTTTYDSARQSVDNLAHGLVSVGIRAGDKIGLLGEHNCSDWCISYLAILRIGAVVVPLDPSLKIGELVALLSNCEASGIISSVKAIEDLQSIKGDIPSLKHIILLDQEKSQSASSLGNLIDKGKEQTHSFPQVEPGSMAVLIYTSGTTGKPKGVMLSHTNIVTNIMAVHKRLHFNNTDVTLSILPLHHTFECTCGFLNSVALGLTVVFARSYKSNELLEDIRDNNVSFMCGVPLLYEKMYLGFKRKIAKSPILKRMFFKTFNTAASFGLKLNQLWGTALFRSLRTKAGLSSLRMLISGGAALPVKVSHFFNTIGIPMLQGYGLSETSPVIAVNSVEQNKLSSIGRPLDGVEVQIDRPDPHGRGEIVVKGPMIMLGYYKDDDETSKVLKDGWFSTGDIGRIDSDGYMYITGRSKNVIVSSAGKNIHPEEIEVLLNESPYILESLVLGRKVPDSTAEDIIAVIVPDREIIQQEQESGRLKDQISLNDIIQTEVTSVCSRLADFKRIKKHYICYEELPKTTTRKIKRSLEIDADGNLFEKKRIG
jgi:long-chain acyl-CoA synthetase